jgi:hypothetical protein
MKDVVRPVDYHADDKLVDQRRFDLGHRLARRVAAQCGAGQHRAGSDGRRAQERPAIE